MRITIAERLKPFSHKPGTALMLPGSSLNLSINPIRLFVLDFAKGFPLMRVNIVFDLEGLVEGFTVIQDLEKGVVKVFGTAVEGYFRYTLQSLENGEGILLTLEKGPAEGIKLICEGEWTSEKTKKILPKEKIIFSNAVKSVEDKSMPIFSSFEKLSLGNHKKQDWDLVRRRLSFDEIFPVWHRLGQMVISPSTDALTGTALLLEKCQEAITANAPEKILSSFKELFLTGFSGILSPRLMDSDFHGIKGIDVDFSLAIENKVSSISLLTEGSKLIRSLFIQEKNKEIHILPALPPEFHCGRFLDVKCAKGQLSLEWTKKSIRQMTFTASEDQCVSFIFFDDEKKCRLRTSNKDRGIVYIPGTSVDVIAGQNYWFDNFVR